MDLSTEFCGVKLSNPTILASGILGVTGQSLADVVNNGAGAVTTKSIWLKPHEGHKNPVMLADGDVFMNAVGLSDAGIEKAKEEIAEFRKNSKAPLIANIVAAKMDDFSELASIVSTFNPDLIEVNISCPNVEDEFGRPFACDIRSASEVTKIVRKNTGKKFSVKLSPNVSNIGDIAKSCEDAGADAITAINTVGPGMRINIEMRKPILANKVGGVSGPCIFPIAVKCVNDIFKSVKIPIIGLGGLTTGVQAIEIMMAGASLVGIGTGIHYRGVNVFKSVCDEISEWCDENGVKNLSEIIGVI